MFKTRKSQLDAEVKAAKTGKQSMTDDARDERDPRIEPRPGDVLKQGGSTLAVNAVVARRVRGMMGEHEAETFDLDVAIWQRWAATAEVVERGE